MLLLVDENVPDSVTAFFSERGHDVRLVREILPRGTPDPVVAALGNDMGAIVVTWNHRHFRALIERSNLRFPALGRLSFRCPEGIGRQRVEEVIDLIEFEYASAQRRDDKRVLMEIREHGVLIH